jgi:hypothetical protein
MQASALLYSSIYFVKTIKLYTVIRETSIDVFNWLCEMYYQGVSRKHLEYVSRLPAQRHPG